MTYILGRRECDCATALQRKRGERVSRSKAKISSKSNFLSVSGYSLHLWEVLCVHFTEGKQRPEWLVGWTRALWVPRNVSRAHTHRFLEPNLFLWTFASSIAAHVKSWDPWADEILRTELKCHNFKISFQFFWWDHFCASVLQWSGTKLYTNKKQITLTP